VAAEQRLEQARLAIGWIQQRAAQSPQTTSDRRLPQASLIAALNSTDLYTLSVDALALFGTRDAQQALLDAASQNARPLPQRQAAAVAFQQSCARFGVLLTQAQIALQYERYNQSRSLDQATQTLLGGLLDVIESPRPSDA
jgi:hypothetical protein